VAIDLELLKGERERLTTLVREVEADQRKLELQVKQLRQREIRARRELEALSTLIGIHEPPKDEAPEGASTEAPAH
jgi:septation ring formation regulator EzrA